MNLADTGGGGGGGGGSTPPSEWIAPPSWWVGADLAGGQGDHHNRANDGGTGSRNHEQREEQKKLLRASNDGHRQRASTLVSFEPEENRVRIPPEKQPGVVGRDPRSMFGDLPNSSFDTDLLGDPIRRELDQRGELTAANTIPLVYQIYNTRTYSHSYDNRTYVQHVTTEAVTSSPKTRVRVNRCRCCCLLLPSI